MNERQVQFRVGVVVTATALITVILVMLFNDAGSPLSFFRRQKTLHISFPSAPGVTDGTPVRKSGILIGRVKKVEFNQESGVTVTVGIDPEIKIRRDEVCRIKSTIVGDAVLEFVPRHVLHEPAAAPDGKPAPLPPTGQINFLHVPVHFVQNEPAAGEAKGDPKGIYLEDGEYVEGVVTPNPLETFGDLQGNLQSAADSVAKAGDQISQLAGRVNQIIGGNEDQFNRIVNKTELALDKFTHSMEAVDGFLGDEELRADLKNAFKDLPTLMSETREAVAAIQKMSASADENLENLKGFTGPLGKRGENMVNKLESTITVLNSLLDQFSGFGEALNNREGTLGQLVHNPDLYQNLNRAACNIQEATEKLRPILNDVRVFTDKISRDPGRLGVSGAIRRDGPIK